MASEKMSTAATLTSILQRLRFVEENQVKSMVMLRTLRLEVEDACGRLQELEYSHKVAVGRINGVLQQYSKQMSAMSTRKEQEKIRTAFRHLQEEMEGEKETCHLLRMQNKKLSKELHHASCTAASACQELEQERKTRELMEDVCDELAKEIERDKAEVEHLKKEQHNVKGVEEEQRMLKLAALCRSKEGTRPNHYEGQLSEVHADDDGDEHSYDRHRNGRRGVAVHDLKSKLEAFVSMVGSACHGSIEDLERHVEQAAVLRQALDSILSQEVNDCFSMEEDVVAHSEKLNFEPNYLTPPHHDGTCDLSERKFINDVEKEKEHHSPLLRVPIIDHRNAKRLSTVRRGASTDLRCTKSKPIAFDAASHGQCAISKQGLGYNVTQVMHSDDHNLSKKHLTYSHSSDTHTCLEEGEQLGMVPNVCSKGIHRLIAGDIVTLESKLCSFSDQEVGESFTSNCKNNVTRAGHRKRLSLQCDSAGDVSLNGRHMDYGVACAQTINTEDLKNSLQHAERVKGQEGACIQGKLGYSRSECYVAKCDDDGSAYRDTDADLGGDECEDFYSEPVHLCPAQGPSTHSTVNGIIPDDGQYPVTSEGLKHTPHNEIINNLEGVPSTIAEANCSDDRNSAISRKKEPVGRVSNNHFTPIQDTKCVGDPNHPAKLLASCTANYGTCIKSSQDEAMGNKAATAIRPLLRSSGQSGPSTSRPVTHFWSTSPTNYASISGGRDLKSGGGAGNLLPPTRKCQQQQKYLTKVSFTDNGSDVTSKYNKTDAVNVNFLGSNDDNHNRNNNDMKPQQQQQQPSQVVKSNSLRAQLIKARQVETTEVIRKEYPTSRIRFSPFRTRPIL